MPRHSDLSHCLGMPIDPTEVASTAQRNWDDETVRYLVDIFRLTYREVRKLILRADPMFDEDREITQGHRFTYEAWNTVFPGFPLILHGGSIRKVDVARLADQLLADDTTLKHSPHYHRLMDLREHYRSCRDPREVAIILHRVGTRRGAQDALVMTTHLSIDRDQRGRWSSKGIRSPGGCSYWYPTSDDGSGGVAILSLGVFGSCLANLDTDLSWMHSAPIGWDEEVEEVARMGKRDRKRLQRQLYIK